MLLGVVRPAAVAVPQRGDDLGLGLVAGRTVEPRGSAAIGAHARRGAGRLRRDGGAAPDVRMAAHGDVSGVDRRGIDLAVASGELERDIRRARAGCIGNVRVVIAIDDVGVVALPEFGEGQRVEEGLRSRRRGAVDRDLIGQGAAVVLRLGAQRGRRRRGSDIEVGRVHHVSADVALLDELASAVEGRRRVIGRLRAQLPMRGAGVPAGLRRGRAECAGLKDGVANGEIVELALVLDRVVDANGVEIEVVLAVLADVERSGVGRRELDVIQAVVQTDDLEHGDLVIIQRRRVVHRAPVVRFHALDIERGDRAVRCGDVALAASDEEALRLIAHLEAAVGIDDELGIRAGGVLGAVPVAADGLLISHALEAVLHIFIAAIGGDDLVDNALAGRIGDLNHERAGVVRGDGDDVEAGAREIELDERVLHGRGRLRLVLGHVDPVDAPGGILRIDAVIVRVVFHDVGGRQAGGLLRDRLGAERRPRAVSAVGIGKGGVGVLIIDGGGGLDGDGCRGGLAVCRRDGIGAADRSAEEAVGRIGDGHVAVHGKVGLCTVQNHACRSGVCKDVVCEDVEGHGAVKVHDDGVVIGDHVRRLLADGDLDGGSRDVRRLAAFRVGRLHAGDIDGDDRSGGKAGDVEAGRAVGVLCDGCARVVGRPDELRFVDREAVPGRFARGVSHELAERVGRRAEGNGEVAGRAAVMGDLRGVGEPLDIDLVGRLARGRAVSGQAGEGHGEDGVLRDVGIIQLAVCSDADGLGGVGVVHNAPRGAAALDDAAGLAVFVRQIVDNIGVKREDALCGGRARGLVDRVLNLGVRAGGRLVDHGGIGGNGRADDHLCLRGNRVVDVVQLVMDDVADLHQRIGAGSRAVGREHAGARVDGHGVVFLNDAPRRLADLRPVGVVLDVGGERAGQRCGRLAVRNFARVGDRDLLAGVIDLRAERVGVAKQEEVIASTGAVRAGI